MTDIEHPDIERIERTGYPSNDYLNHEHEQNHSSSTFEDELNFKISFPVFSSKKCHND